MTQKKQKNKFRQEKYIRQRYSERTGKWSFRVEIRQTDSSGCSRSYSNTFQEGKGISAKTAYTMAIQDRDKYLNQIRTTGVPKKNTHCVLNVFNQMMELSANSFETKRKKEITFNKWVDANYRSILIKDLKAANIQACLNEAKEKGCSETIMRYLCTIWHDICLTAIKYEYIYVDVFQLVDVPKIRTAVSVKDVSTNKEIIEKVCEAVMKHTEIQSNKQFMAQLICYAIRLCWYTGMRPAECFALEKKHVDFDKRLIYIRQSIGATDRRTNYIRDPKTKRSIRDIPMTDAIKSLLEELNNKQKSNFLFADQDGKLINSARASSKIKYACDHEGLEFNMYRCRHQFSTDLIMSGHDARTVMELMGHNNVGMTYEYARSDNDAKLNALLEKE